MTSSIASITITQQHNDDNEDDNEDEDEEEEEEEEENTTYINAIVRNTKYKRNKEIPVEVR